MKKLIIAMSLLFALGASAQAPKTAPAAASAAVTTQMSIQTKAKKNVEALNAFTPLNEATKVNMLDIFVTKYKIYNELGAHPAPERRTYIAGIVESKLQAALEPGTFAAVKANSALFKSLVDE